MGSLTYADTTGITVSLTSLFEHIAFVAELVGLIWLCNRNNPRIDCHGQQITNIYNNSRGLLHIIVWSIQLAL